MNNRKKLDRKIKIGKNLFIWFFVLVVMIAIAVGDTDEPAITSEVETESAVTVAEEALQSFKFNKDEAIRDALRVLAVRYEKNIVPSPQVDGILGFTSLFNVTFDDAMEAILGSKFAYEQKGNLIEVFPIGDKSRMKHEVFALHYISAAEARKLIEPILSGEGRVGTTTAAETGVPTGESISAPSGGGDTMSLQDTIVVYDYAENIKRARKLIATIDIRPKEVLVEATIMSATLTENMQFGIDWATLDTAAQTVASSVTDGFLTGTGRGAVTLSGGLSVGVIADDVASIVQAVEKVTDITVLANPKILAVNKQLGQVYIGNKLGYRDGDTETAAGGTEEGEVKFLDTGTKLSFRPYIGEDGYIRMDIHSKDSSGSVSSGIPSEDSAELVSNVIVKDGETVAIGGLFRDEVTTVRTQIPLLGDIPIIGFLFRGTDDKVVRREVIVLLTPHIIEEPGEINGDARIADAANKRQGAREGLQWEARSRLAEDRYLEAVKYYKDGDNESALRELKHVLTMRPTYMEALRLREKILGESDAGTISSQLGQVITSDFDSEHTDKWERR